MNGAGGRRLRVSLVEPWYGGSHRAWADGLVRHSRHDVHLVTHEASFWRWRLRGGAVTLAAALQELTDRVGPPDVVVVSDMVDVASLRGLARQALGRAPVLLYLHENQVTQDIVSASRGEPGSGTSDAAWATWRSLVAADRAVAGTAFHREALLAALPDLLAGAPDRRHDTWLEGVVAKTGVLPVGVELAGLLRAERAAPDGGPPLIVWNQRWDHDKQPEALLRVLVALADAGVAFRLALAGPNTRADPQEFVSAVEALGDRVVHVGELERSAYEALLLRADVVVSTARHELFGMAPVEAMAAGCVPLLPWRLSYPEIVPAAFHEAVLYRGRLFDRLRSVLEDLPAARRSVHGLRPSMSRHDWSVVVAGYDDLLEAMAAGG